MSRPSYAPGVRSSPLTAGVRRTDVVIAGAFLLVSLVQVLWIQPLGSLVVSLVYTCGMVLPLAWRHARPAVAAFVVSSTWWIPTEAYLFLGFVIAIMLFFSVGRWRGDWRIGALVCAWAVVSGTVATLRGDEPLVPGIFVIWLVILAPYGIGRVMTAQELENDAHLRAERDAIRQKAVEEERARIVRELHDVVGHEVTLMAIQSEAAAQALTRAPERAEAPIHAVRETAHRANRQLRAILDLLGEGEHAVAPDSRGLAELTDRAARLGIPNTLTVTGKAWDEAPQHWLAVNRIVQECLTNAGKHAAGANVDVRVDWAADGVHVHAANPAPPADRRSGLGIPGMVERARTLGGTLESRHEDGRFTVEAWLPAAGERT
jgi:signal transduction histidine kinase